MHLLQSIPPMVWQVSLGIVISSVFVACWPFLLVVLALGGVLAGVVLAFAYPGAEMVVILPLFAVVGTARGLQMLYSICAPPLRRVLYKKNADYSVHRAD